MQEIEATAWRHHVLLVMDDGGGDVDRQWWVWRRLALGTWQFVTPQWAASTCPVPAPSCGSPSTPTSASVNMAIDNILNPFPPPPTGIKEPVRLLRSIVKIPLACICSFESSARLTNSVQSHEHVREAS